VVVPRHDHTITTTSDHHFLSVAVERVGTTLRDALQHTAAHGSTHYNTREHTTTHCNTRDHTAAHGNTRQHKATHGNTRQRTATHGNARQRTATHGSARQRTATHSARATLEKADPAYTATHCNTLHQKTATHT